MVSSGFLLADGLVAAPRAPLSTAERFQASVAEQKQASGAMGCRYDKGPDRAPCHICGADVWNVMAW